MSAGALIMTPTDPYGRTVHCSMLAEDAIKSALKERLAKFKQPKRVLFADELPRNAMGKVQKAALRETYKDTFAS